MSDSPEYPNCEILRSRGPSRRAIHSFLEWLQDEKRVNLGMYDEDGRMWPLQGSVDNLLMEYFGIDTTELENERRAMLDEMRRLNSG